MLQQPSTLNIYYLEFVVAVLNLLILFFNFGHLICLMPEVNPDAVSRKINSDPQSRSLLEACLHAIQPSLLIVIVTEQ
jgi:hypothetical protein